MSSHIFFAVTLGLAVLAASINAPREHINQVVQTGERVASETRYEYDSIKMAVEDLPRELEQAAREVQSVWSDFSARVAQQASALKHRIAYETHRPT